MPTYTRLGISRICPEDTYLNELKPLGYAPIKEKVQEQVQKYDSFKELINEIDKELSNEDVKVATPKKGGRPRKK